MKSIRGAKSAKVSTYRTILDRSIEMTNELGVVDFRIDSLAASLKLSPGNITYHFAKKEEICSMIWSEYLVELQQKAASLSSILDLKQLYLVIKDIAVIMYRYRGVVCYMGGEVKSLEIEGESSASYMNIIRDLFKRATMLLERNGYLNHTSGRMAEIAMLHHVAQMRWWINFYIIESVVSKSSEEMIVRECALSILYSLYPDMSELGRREAEEIKRLLLSES